MKLLARVAPPDLTENGFYCLTKAFLRGISVAFNSDAFTIYKQYVTQFTMIAMDDNLSVFKRVPSLEHQYFEHLYKLPCPDSEPAFFSGVGKAHISRLCDMLKCNIKMYICDKWPDNSTGLLSFYDTQLTSVNDDDEQPRSTHHFVLTLDKRLFYFGTHNLDSLLQTQPFLLIALMAGWEMTINAWQVN